ncbi:hypothetical protein ROK90_03815 [Cronobacter dublinensis]|uniref:hypothetical protein n=1 Tax=Cronobacter dublinensis TaxID=413497 RepID=UPI0023DD3303|nr:hypothetical protein [Cronobacter dublinensis]MDT3665142.1 hypothetical protein [Cronobacter dublinensis]WEP44211.1 hypothetical protein NNQ27_15375 [Cronobacter dublinensis]
MHETSQELKNKLIDGLALYLRQGYIDPYYINCDCIDEGAEEAAHYLSELDAIDEVSSAFFRKKIVESAFMQNGLFKSHCLGNLLLSDKHRAWAVDYLIKNHHHLLSEPLKAAMFYFFCAKNDPCDHDVIPAPLITGLKSRYQKIMEENPASRYKSLSAYELLTDGELSALTEEYNAFCKAYP